MKNQPHLVLNSPICPEICSHIRFLSAKWSHDMKNFLPLTLAVMMSWFLPSHAMAQEPVYQGTHRDWRVFTRGEGEARMCYALTRPTDERPESADHGDVFFLVTSFASGVAEEQPNFVAGYPLMPDRAPVARVGSNRFEMFVSDQEGFVEDLDDESRLVSAMRRGSTMRIEAMSTRGTATAYTFSLSGVTAALRQVEQLCG